jgi:2,3-bisphosphoglycerate-independent phosphoglycerate mutase
MKSVYKTNGQEEILYRKSPFKEDKPPQKYTGPKPVVLLILDGWGLGSHNDGNAIDIANTPNMDRYMAEFPHTQLKASGEAVGLSPRVDGNSETGHTNIGAGTIVYQELPRIDTTIADGSFFKNEAFHKAFQHVKRNNSTLHLLGLVGAGYVHSSLHHMYALLNLCKQEGINQVYIHAFTDGRDSPPNSAVIYIKEILEKCKQLGLGQIATLMGRYYAMDRDKRWDRIERAYNSVVLGYGACIKDPVKAIQEQYARNITDEFIEPLNICNGDGSTRLIQDNDAVIFYNYRVDRPRELTRAFVMPDFEQGIKKESYDPHLEKYEKTHIQKIIAGETFQRKKILKNLCFVTMTQYDDTLPVNVAFPPQDIKNNLGKVLSKNGVRQLRITEMEKRKMVTLYINGRRKQPYPGEDWIIVHSKGVKSYDQAPEMSAREIGAKIIEVIAKDSYDAIICNIANPDMVGHTGDMKAVIKACEVTDQVTGKIVEAVLKKDGIVIITADHGNAEELINYKTNTPDTEHSTNPVPFIVVSNRHKNWPQLLPEGILADVAPTMLQLMGLEIPEQMTGIALIK